MVVWVGGFDYMSCLLLCSCVSLFFVVPLFGYMSVCCACVSRLRYGRTYSYFCIDVVVLFPICYCV